VLDDEVILIAVRHQQHPAIGRAMGRLMGDAHAAKIKAHVLAEGVIMVAGDVDDLCAALGLLEDAANDLIVGGRPVPALLDGPEVENVTDEIQPLAHDVLKKRRKLLGPHAAEAQMRIADENGSETGAHGVNSEKRLAQGAAVAGLDSVLNSNVHPRHHSTGSPLTQWQRLCS